MTQTCLKVLVSDMSTYQVLLTQRLELFSECCTKSKKVFVQGQSRTHDRQKETQRFRQRGTPRP